MLLREPTLSASQVEALVESLLPLYPPGGVVVHEKCANARAIASAHGLGLHLRSTSDWRSERAGWPGQLGVSAHSQEELRLAVDLGMQWAFFSPVARPTSKPGDDRPPIGEEAILDAQERLPQLDIYALGGISPAMASRLAAGGARGIAVLGGLFPAGAATTTVQAEAAARRYLDALGEAASDTCSSDAGNAQVEEGSVACSSRGTRGDDDLEGTGQRS